MSDQGRSDSGRNETPLERADRNFTELLQELRVTQTGVQILFAFLLTLAFTPRFPSLDTMQRATYVTTLLVVVDVAASRTGAIAAAAGTLLVCGGLWGLLPRAVARAGERSGEVRSADAEGGKGSSGLT
ncbi:DUF6328 family protein [Streptomyces lasiicapitis]|uniref:DUF6328 family protein n=1 Tax=Streptomyces lasiicapitis TaxID=1923961 RepID=UPI003654A2E5